MWIYFINLVAALLMPTRRLGLAVLNACIKHVNAHISYLQHLQLKVTGQARGVLGRLLVVRVLCESFVCGTVDIFY